MAFQTIWANQWEPSTKKQHAAEIYLKHFGAKGFSNEDIEEVIEKNFDSIPDHDLLVGGFPCQDYSVASTLNRSHGLVGKKGVLFWSIYSILKNKGEEAPKYFLLENVDRLLKSPASQRGKDFAIMLATLSDLGYAIEWRVINAADYGFTQRRRRVFILGYKVGTPLFSQIRKNTEKSEWISNSGIFAETFPVSPEVEKFSHFKLTGSAKELSNNFSSSKPSQSPFNISGVMINREVYTGKTSSLYHGEQGTLGSILIPEKDVPEEFFIKESDVSRWKYYKEAKRELRTSKSGHKYHYSEGPISFPDSTDKPSRTIITGEGGAGPSRFKHIVSTPSGRVRRLTPIELERLNEFPDNHTQSEGISDTRRAFLMGNALVVGVVSEIGKTLLSRIHKS